MDAGVGVTVLDTVLMTGAGRFAFGFVVGRGIRLALWAVMADAIALLWVRVGILERFWLESGFGEGMAGLWGILIVRVVVC